MRDLGPIAPTTYRRAIVVAVIQTRTVVNASLCRCEVRWIDFRVWFFPPNMRRHEYLSGVSSSVPQWRWTQRVTDIGLNHWALKQRIDCWKECVITLTGDHCPILHLSDFNAIPNSVCACVCACPRVRVCVCFLYYSNVFVTLSFSSCCPTTTETSTSDHSCRAGAPEMCQSISCPPNGRVSLGSSRAVGQHSSFTSWPFAIRLDQRDVKCLTDPEQICRSDLYAQSNAIILFVCKAHTHTRIHTHVCVRAQSCTNNASIKTHRLF